MWWGCSYLSISLFIDVCVCSSFGLLPTLCHDNSYPCACLKVSLRNMPKSKITESGVLCIFSFSHTAGFFQNRISLLSSQQGEDTPSSPLSHLHFAVWQVWDWSPKNFGVHLTQTSPTQIPRVTQLTPREDKWKVQQLKKQNNKKLQWVIQPLLLEMESSFLYVCSTHVFSPLHPSWLYFLSSFLKYQLRPEFPS